MQKIVGVALSHSIMHEQQQQPSPSLLSIPTTESIKEEKKIEKVVEEKEKSAEEKEMLVEKENEEETSASASLHPNNPLQSEEANDFTKDAKNKAEEKEKEKEEVEKLRITNKSLQFALQMLQDSEPPSKVCTLVMHSVWCVMCSAWCGVYMWYCVACDMLYCVACVFSFSPSHKYTRNQFLM